MNWNIEKGQQGKNVLSSRLFRRVYFSFRFEMSWIINENDKNLKSS